MVEPRKSSLRKAPAVDVLDAITASHSSGADRSRGSSEERSSVAVPVPPLEGNMQRSAPLEAQAHPSGRPVGPGRPRGRRRMEPFSSKIEIGLRDDIDSYLVAHEMTMVDFLDEALRMRLNQP